MVAQIKIKGIFHKESLKMANSNLRQSFNYWQELNGRLKKVWEEFNYQYLALFDKAQICQLDTSQGLLRIASSKLRQPLDIESLQLRLGIANAFAFLGKSFYRRSPTSLKLDIYHYADSIEETCLQFKRLGKKLRLASEVLELLLHNRNITRHYCNSALFDPEAVWTILLLQQRYRLNQQNSEYIHKHSWQAKISACQNWLNILQNSLADEKIIELQQGLQDLQALCAESTSSGPYSEDAVRKLNFCTALAHQLSGQLIRSLPEEKNIS
jgi:hypothetical protein